MPGFACPHFCVPNCVPFFLTLKLSLPNSPIIAGDAVMVLSLEVLPHGRALGLLSVFQI